MKRLLIIEDDEIVANAFRNKFSSEGYQVEVAGDGEAGLELVRSFRPDAVLLDLMLPKIMGVELMRKLRAEPEFAKLPFIVFSNTYLSNMIREAWAAGATRCLSKAYCTPRQLLDVVRTTLAGHDQRLPATRPTGMAANPGAGPAAGATPLPAPGPAPGEADTAFQAGLRQAFLEGLPARLAALRTLLQAMLKAENQDVRFQQVNELHGPIRALTGNAGAAGMVLLAQMSAALEALLQELRENPRNLNTSTLRTVANAIDFLGVLSRQAVELPRETPPANILVVDDDTLSLRSISHALEKAGLKCTNVSDPNLALSRLKEQHFDLVFLDINMPGMNGFELCTRLRALPEHEQTPVVFVTGLTDLESRASSMMSGGTDFIAKPFLGMELGVKALVYVLRGKLGLDRGPAARAAGPAGHPPSRGGLGF